ncbi:MAG: site-2 protease family protein [Verrucomicrobiota bacterium]|jgi:regulator of sigma E protease|nr:site-2 protease family protein [Verrucomicrobiota bacterium]
MEILNIIYVVAVVFLLFGAAIFVHEFGHFWVALKRGLIVEEFAIGFGPIVWSKEHDGILYSIRLIPAGGFVKLPQMLTSEAIEGKAEDIPETNEEDESGNKNEDDDPEPEEELPEVSPFSKILVAFAGPLMNVIFAFAIAIFIWIVGIPKQINEPVIGYVGKSSEEFERGVRPGDVFKVVNGVEIETWQDVIYAVLDSTGKTVDVTLLRGDEEIKVDLPADTWDGGIRRLRLESRDILKVLSFETPSILGEAGFEPEDVIQSVNGNEAYSQYHLLDMLMANSGEKKTIQVMRKGAVVELEYETPDVAGVKVGMVINEDEDGKATPASKVDIEKGDFIKSSGSKHVTSTLQLIDIIRSQEKGKKLELELIRGKETLIVEVTPVEGRLGIGLEQEIGLSFKPEPIRYSKEPAHPTPIEQINDVLDKIAITFKALGRGKESGVGAKDLSGPVGIFGMLAIQVNHSIMLALGFLVLLNINLAILNLLPVPVLDGGHILMSIIEWIRKEPVSVRVQEWATTAFAALLLCFFVYVTFADVKRVPLLHEIFKRDTQVENTSSSGG